jgi:hypothetical protein
MLKNSSIDPMAISVRLILLRVRNGYVGVSSSFMAQ